MTAVTGPVILSAQEFAAQPLGVDTSKLLKALTTLTQQENANATTIHIADKQGSAPARFDPRTSQIASYAVVAGDLVFVGAGTASDPLEWTVATGAIGGSSSPFTLAVSPGLTYQHPQNSPVSIGSLQQELLAAALACERWCQQPISLTTHPDVRWPPNEYRLGSLNFSVDTDGFPVLYVPFTPIVTSYTPTITYKMATGSANTFTTFDITQCEVLSDRIIFPQGTFSRRQLVIATCAYQSGYATAPDDAKEAHRIVAAEYLKRRGGQAVVTGSGRRIQSTSEKDIDIPAAAALLLNPFKRVR